MENSILIRQCDPKASYLEHEEEIDVAIKNTLESGSYILGLNVNSFEKDSVEFSPQAKTNNTQKLRHGFEKCPNKLFKFSFNKFIFRCFFANINDEKRKVLRCPIIDKVLIFSE